MRLYGKRFADKYIRKKIRPTSETRDGIIFSVDWDAYVCKCRIQGSDEYVNAYFPRNEATIPRWMKPGNAVRILHRTGVRGYFEVIGHGGAIPTPMPGSPERPTTSDLSDAILTGVGMTVEESTMCVHIEEGTVRIGGETYDATLTDPASQYLTDTNPPTMSEAFPPMDMDGPAVDQYVLMTDDDPMYMTETDAVVMGAIAAGTYCVDAAPSAGQFRYDAFVVGADGVVDYLKGTAASSNPSKPTIPADHVLIGDYILVIGGVTELEDGNIGQQWAARVASAIAIDEILINANLLVWPFPEPDEWPFDLANDYPEISVIVRVYDQYGWAMSLGDTITLYLIVGSGLVYSGESGYAATVSQYVGGSAYTFKYQRDQTGAETSPSFLATAGDLVSDLAHVTLLNEYGLPVTGAEVNDDVVQDLDSADSVAVDWSQGSKAKITAAHNVTFSFSGAISNDKLVLTVTQDGTGGRTMTWPSSIRFGAQITEILISTEPNSASYVGFIYHAAAAKYDVVANVSGYGA